MKLNNRLLIYRLRNCLDTILEMESNVIRSDFTELLQSEFNTLKDIVKRLETFNLAEDEVLRIEKATSNFLSELKFVKVNKSEERRLLQ